MTSYSHRKVAVIGLGRFGMALVRELARHGVDVIAIDNEQQLVDEVAADVSIAVRLDSTDESALRSQEVDHVDVVIVAIGENFEASLLTTVICKKNLKIPRVICRAQTHLHAEIFRQIGGDEVIEPEQDAGIMLGRRLAHPRINDYIKLADGFTVLELRAPQEFVNRTIRQINLRTTYQVNLIAIRRPAADGAVEGADAESGSVPTMISVPGPDDLIQEGDILILAGSDESLAKLPQK